MLSGMTRAQVISLALIVLMGLAGLGAIIFALAPAFQTNSLPAPTVQAPANTPIPSPGAQAVATLVSTLVQPALPTAAPSQVVTAAAANPLACLPRPLQVEEARALAVLAEAQIQVELAGKTALVRLIGVDPAGSGGQVLALLRELVAGNSLRLLGDGQDADAQGSLLRYVLAGDTFVNYEMVRRGAALPALYPPGMACMESFLSAERLARAEGLGYWSLQTDLPGAALPAATPAAQPCDCAQTYACADFKTRAAAQSCYNACGDYRNTTLDPDHNGLACEALP
jgi:endonuclease YncB( thermonuclease family)